MGLPLLKKDAQASPMDDSFLSVHDQSWAIAFNHINMPMSFQMLN
jgi:hypothetical protein